MCGLAPTSVTIHTKFRSMKEVFIDNISHGWFIYLEGSYESIYFSDDRPGFEPGDLMEVIIRKRTT